MQRLLHLLQRWLHARRMVWRHTRLLLSRSCHLPVMFCAHDCLENVSCRTGCLVELRFRHLLPSDGAFHLLRHALCLLQDHLSSTSCLQHGLRVSRAYQVRLYAVLRLLHALLLVGLQLLHTELLLRAGLHLLQTLRLLQTGLHVLKTLLLLHAGLLLRHMVIGEHSRIVAIGCTSISVCHGTIVAEFERVRGSNSSFGD